MASGRGGRGFDAKLGASLSKLGGAKRLGGIGGASARLSSIRPARDLTLGGQPKRTFTPNIPVRRVKEEPDSKTSEEPSKNNKDKKSGRPERSHGRERGKREIVASASIFSHGPFAGPKVGGFIKGEKAESSKEAVSRKSIMGSSKSGEDITDESQKILDMLKDEGKIELDDMLSGNLMPITIPLANSKLLQKKEEPEERISDDNDVKMMIDKAGHSDVRSPVRSKTQQGVRGNREKSIQDISCAELFTRRSQEDKLLFLQFPDALPINTLSSDRASSTKINDEQQADTTSSRKPKEEDLEQSLKKFSFNNVSEGYIGKLQIHKSGRVKLLLGNATLDLSMGIPCGFLQDLVSVHTGDGRKEMLSLGHVSHRLVCTPNYDDLLGSLNTVQQMEEGQT